MNFTFQLIVTLAFSMLFVFGRVVNIEASEEIEACSKLIPGSQQYEHIAQGVTLTKFLEKNDRYHPFLEVQQTLKSGRLDIATDVFFDPVFSDHCVMCLLSETEGVSQGRLNQFLEGYAEKGKHSGYIPDHLRKLYAAERFDLVLDVLGSTSDNLYEIHSFLEPVFIVNKDALKES